MGEGLGYVLPVKKTGFANMAIQSEMTDPDRAYTSLAVLAYFCQFYINIQCNKKYISMVEFSKYKVLSMESKSQDWELEKLTVKTLLRSRLQTAMERANMPETALKLDEIPLNRSQNSLGVVYISAIALKLAKVCQQTPQAIATQLAATLQAMCHPDFAVTLAPSAIIEFELTPPALAWWLQRLAQTPIPVTQSRIISPILSADRLFPLQYSHARCCSLVRMAHRDRLIAIAQPDVATTPQIWSLTAPNPLPWLDNEQLRLIHPAESNLISQLLTVLDSLAFVFGECNQERAIDYFKLANSLSTAFQTFYSQCRIWGEIKRENLKLAQARLGLVLATQSLLRFILEELLNAIAPLEL
ncbi:MAG: DALR anticodon-binding domain-containing protein [Microcoleus sp.]